MIASNIATVQSRVQRACNIFERNPASVGILAVSKTKPIAAIREAYAAGQRHFGENYAQELFEKVDANIGDDIAWHFIGPMQSNKTRGIAERASWVHSVDRVKIAKRLNDQRPTKAPPLNICIQVNIDDEPTKSGVSTTEVITLAKRIHELPHLKLRGLMAIPTPHADEARTRRSFQKVAELLSEINDLTEFKDTPLDTLSMGMSADLELAIAEGSTMVRVGTDIFGAREKKHDQ